MSKFQFILDHHESTEMPTVYVHPKPMRAAISLGKLKRLKMRTQLPIPFKY